MRERETSHERDGDREITMRGMETSHEKEGDKL